MACVSTGGLPIGIAACTGALLSPVDIGKTGWIGTFSNVFCRQLCRHARQLLGLPLLLLQLNLLRETREHIRHRSETRSDYAGNGMLTYLARAARPTRLFCRQLRLSLEVEGQLGSRLPCRRR